MTFSRQIMTGLFLTLVINLSAVADKPVLTVYTYDSFISDWGPGPKVKQAFEQQCNCSLKLVGLADGVSLLNRLKLEGKNSKADIVLGIDTSLTAEARASGLFAAHHLSTPESSLPQSWSDDLFLPYDFGYFAFIYNKNLLKNPPGSLHQLVENSSGPKILIQDPRTSTPGLGLLLWMKKVYGDQSNKAWQQLSERIVTVSKGWSEAYGLFLKGEADLVLSYTTSPAYHIIAEKDKRFAALHFEEGHYQQIEVAGLLKSGQQKALSRQFLQFMMSKKFQSIIPETNWMYPAFMQSSSLPDGFQKLIDPSPVLLFKDSIIASKRKAWVNEWLDAMAN